MSDTLFFEELASVKLSWALRDLNPRPSPYEGAATNHLS